MNPSNIIDYVVRNGSNVTRSEGYSIASIDELARRRGSYVGSLAAGIFPDGPPPGDPQQRQGIDPSTNTKPQTPYDSSRGQITIKKKVDPLAYQKLLVKRRLKMNLQFDLGKYYHELAFSRSINHDALHTQTHSIRYS